MILYPVPAKSFQCYDMVGNYTTMRKLGSGAISFS